jgi:hypothetical protein
MARGIMPAFVAASLVDRERAAHAAASRGLVVTWIAGYLLTALRQLPMTELWIAAAITRRWLRSSPSSTAPRAIDGRSARS